MSTTEMNSTHTTSDVGHVSTLADAFARTVAEQGDRPALCSIDGELTVSWAEFGERSRRIAAGLAALGLRRGDVVALLLTQRLEGALVDAAAMQLGVTTVSLYPGDSLENVRHILTDSGARVLMTERALAPRPAGCDATLDHVIAVDGGEAGMTVTELEELGDPDFDLAPRRDAIEPGDLVSILYTSGTTGPPKGTIHTNAT